MFKSRSQPTPVLKIILILGISLLVHWPFFFKPLTQAEAVQIMAVHSHPFSFYHYQPQQFGYEPPGIYYLLKGAGKLVNTANYADTRTIAAEPSQIIIYNFAIFVLPNLLTLWGIYLLGSKFLKQKTVNILCFLLAFLPIFCLAGQTILPFFWILTCVTWSWLFLLELLGLGRERVVARRGSLLEKILRHVPFGYTYLLFLVFTLLGIYTSYFYFFFLLAQLAALVFCRRWRRLAVTIFFVLIVYLPWLPFIHRQLQIIPIYQQIVESLTSP